MQAIILAAGMGRRLKELTQNQTKCMVKVNGVTLIDRMLHQLEKKHLSQIVVVVGYEGQKLIDYISTLNIYTPIVFINNPIYDKTNNIYSLFLAREYLKQEDTILLESDLIFEDTVLDTLIQDPRTSLALVDKYQSWMDGTCIKLDENDQIIAFIPGKKFRFEERDSYYKTVNLYKFSRQFAQTCYVPFLEAYSTALGSNEYYEQVLKVVIALDQPEICAKRLNGELWYEIDDIQDLDIAESIFTPDEEEKVALLQGRFGGYWRYPKLLDFCYLVNPYFPPQRMVDEIKASFEKLLTEYPSGMRVNSLLAAKNFDVQPENIVVGNGAAELIKSLMEQLEGRVGFISPTFEEYHNRYDRKKSVTFVPDNPDYAYSVKDITAYFSDKNLSALIVINPDNPSGNYIPKKDMLELVSWCAARKIKLIVDESFIDFAEEENNTLIDQTLLTQNPHLYVIKSISKSYGVPGLRLGILASGDTKTVTLVKQDVAIWNINSFAEFYLQIEEKYKADYHVALGLFRQERARFQSELCKINQLRVIPSQANFIMVELLEGLSPKVLLKKLLIKHNLLIKELMTKTNGRDYIRLAVRNPEDNNVLLEALRKELGEQ